jgi:glutaminyl-peptide cyclotransferase
MNKGRSIFIIVVLIAVVAAFVLGPLLGNKNSEETIKAAHFDFDENLAAKYGELIPLKIVIPSEEITKLELFYNDSLFQTWNNPSKDIMYDFKASFFGLGAKQLTIQSTMKNGNIATDSRLVRVLSDVSPENWTLAISESFPHNPSHFIQGFEMNDGVLFESTGQRGQSKVMHIDLKTGNATKEIGLDANYFGEGITIMGDKLYQITWQEQKCFVYNKKTLELENDISYTGEGWGLTNDGKSLIMSDGTERIVFRNPTTFQIERSIEVYDQVGPRTRINELEFIDGLIFANVWMLDLIIVIDPNIGKVLAEIDGSEIAKIARGKGEVMNGIAYDKSKGLLYLTGKYWSKTVAVNVQKESVL